MGSLGEDIPWQFDLRMLVAGRLNHEKGKGRMWDWENSGPLAMLELWHFALRHYLYLGFRSKTFWMPRMPTYTQSLSWKGVGTGKIFMSAN